jgi:hypothetical protein
MFFAKSSYKKRPYKMTNKINSMGVVFGSLKSSFCMHQFFIYLNNILLSLNIWLCVAHSSLPFDVNYSSQILGV